MAKTPFFHHLGTGSAPIPYTVPAGKYLVVAPIYFGASVAVNFNGVQAHSESSPEMKALSAPAGTVITLSGGTGRAAITGFLYDNDSAKTSFLWNMGTGGSPNAYTVPEGFHLIAVPIYFGLVVINIGGLQIHQNSSPAMKAIVAPSATEITLSGGTGRVHLTGFLYPNEG